MKINLPKYEENHKQGKQTYMLNYEFEIPPSPFIAMDRVSGRFFIYNNRDKILVFSKEPVMISEREDKSKPLIEIELKDQYPYRIDPTLYIIEEKDFSMLLVIGGYKKHKNK